jgi:SNF2 family DNA or RNA helicase
MLPIKTKPFQHQIQAFEFGMRNPSTALLMEQGCGKTLTTIAIAGARFLQREVRKLLVIAPTSVVPVWPKEFDVHADFPFEVKALEGSTTKRKQTISTWNSDSSVLQVAVINYEGSWRMDDVLRKWKPEMIVLDESQRIKSHTAKQSKEIHKLGTLANYRIILTGTPITNGPMEFFSQYKFLNPSIFGNSFYSFRSRYATMGGYQNYQIIGYKNLDELTQKAHAVAYRVTKEDALDLPEFTDQILYCEPESTALSTYHKVASESYVELEKCVVSASTVLTKLLRLSQITGGYVGDEDGGVIQVSKAKQKVLAETMDDLISAGKKAVVFARFIPEIQAIEKMLEQKKIGFVRISGGTTNRGALVDQFQNDPNCKVFLGQLKAVREGLTLTAADTAIFYSLDYSYADYAQAKARIHRIGQKNHCTYVHLIVKDTVDEQVMEALANKKSMADLIVDNWRKLFKGGKKHGINRVRVS